MRHANYMHTCYNQVQVYFLHVKSIVSECMGKELFLSKYHFY